MAVIGGPAAIEPGTLAHMNAAYIGRLELEVATLTAERAALRLQVERLQGTLRRTATDLEENADAAVADMRVRAAALRAAADREQAELEL